MEIQQKICFVLLLTTFPSVYAGSCFEKPGDLDDCITKAEQGDARAQYNLGWIYRVGKQIPQDYNEVVSWYRKSAMLGHAPAQTQLGVMYNLGWWGVNQDYKAAVKWYRKAADQDNPLGQLRLASFYSQGKGVAKNLKEAEKWFLRFANYNGDYDYVKKMIKEMYANNEAD